MTDKELVDYVWKLTNITAKGNKLCPEEMKTGVEISTDMMYQLLAIIEESGVLLDEV